VALLIDLIDWYAFTGVPTDKLMDQLKRQRDEWRLAQLTTLRDVTPLGESLLIRERSSQYCLDSLIQCVDSMLGTKQRGSEGSEFFQPLFQLLTPALPYQVFRDQSKFMTAIVAADRGLVNFHVPVVKPRVWDMSAKAAQWSYLPPMAGQKKQTLVLEFESIIATFGSVSDQPDIVFMDDTILAYDNTTPLVQSPESTLVKATRAEIALAADKVIKPWSMPHLTLGIYIRAGIKELCEKAFAVGYELVLWSRRSEFKTNTALHVIDPECKLFPLSHRIYWHRGQDKSRLDRLGRSSDDVLILSFGSRKFIDWVATGINKDATGVNCITLKTPITTKDRTSEQRDTQRAELDQLWSHVLAPLQQTSEAISQHLPSLNRKRK
jgi:hypothetical protein